MSIPALSPKEEDIKYLLACSAHIGTRNVEKAMQKYVWKRRSDGVHLINLAKTWEKLVLAARIIVAVENPADVALIAAQKEGQRAVLKFAQYTGATAISGRFTPGTFTNQIQERFMEPRLLITADPRQDHQPIMEASYVNIPVISFCNTDSSVRRVDCAIPCNNKGAESVGLMYWLLAREVLRLRKSISRNQTWDVIVDVFFYKPPEEAEVKKAEDAPGLAFPEEPYKNPAANVGVAGAIEGAPAVEWGAATVEGTRWEQHAVPESWGGANPNSQWVSEAEPVTVDAPGEAPSWQ